MKRRLVEDIKRQQKLMNIEEQSFFDVEKFMKGSSTPQDATFVSVDTKIPKYLQVLLKRLRTKLLMN